MSLAAERRTASTAVERALSLARFKKVAVGKGSEKFVAFIREAQIAFAILPQLRARHGQLLIEATFCFIDDVFEHSIGNTLHDRAYYRSFCALSTNFRNFRELEWIDVNDVEASTARVIALYGQLAEIYPSTRRELLLAVEHGAVAGMETRFFLASSDQSQNAKFIAWLKASVMS